MSAHIDIHKIPDGHVIVGYIAAIKILDEDGECYFAVRNDGLNMMETLGMAHDLAATAERDVLECGEVPE
ncbi:hypothetical protein [Amycolatopsis japonica]